MPTKLTLVRHGTTEWIEQGLIHGRMDSPLSERGIIEVQSAAKALQGKDFDALYTSPIGRAMQTAHILASALGIQPQPLDGLIEMDFGAREGTRLHAMKPGPMFTVLKMLRWVVPAGTGGENSWMLYRRCKRTLAYLAVHHPNEKLLLVTHYAVINMFLSITTKKYFDFFDIKAASITEIELDGKDKRRLLTDVKVAR